MMVSVKSGVAVGEVFAPPSKSIAHRQLICGALTTSSTIKNIEFSNDIKATLDCLTTLGAKVDVQGNTVVIGGLDPFNIPDGTIIDCSESGSTLRFLLPLCMLGGSKITLCGTKRLFERPLSVYEQICKKQSILFDKGDDRVTVCGRLCGGDYTVSGAVSSQFISGLLFALPLLDESSTITITDKYESASYTALTIDALSLFGVDVGGDERHLILEGGGCYAPREVEAEGDWSNAAFLDGFNILGGNVKVLGLKEDSLQGDRVYRDMYSGLENGVRQFDLSDCPDLAPVMFALAAVKGKTTFYGTARLKIKESDRAKAMKDELYKFGIPVTVNENSVVIEGGDLKKPNEVLCGHNDHRIVMALTLLCSMVGGEISGCEAVNKSFPDFFNKISDLKVDVNLNEN